MARSAKRPDPTDAAPTAAPNTSSDPVAAPKPSSDGQAQASAAEAEAAPVATSNEAGGDRPAPASATEAPADPVAAASAPPPEPPEAAPDREAYEALAAFGLPAGPEGVALDGDDLARCALFAAAHGIDGVIAARVYPGRRLVVVTPDGRKEELRA